MMHVRVEKATEKAADAPGVSAEGSVPPPRPDSRPTSASATPAAPDTRSVQLNDAQRRLLEFIHEQRGGLFALLDAARDDRVLDLLRGSGEQYESLYEGKQAEALANFAPYLVHIAQNSRLLPVLIREGWGKSWGVYLTTDKPFQEVRKHFRHFLLVETEDGKQLYFRFYDPRVLREFLPAFDKSEAKEFIGPIRYYLLEGTTSDLLLRYRLGEEGAHQEVVKLLDSVSIA